jgi:hypothetical protein
MTDLDGSHVVCTRSKSFATTTTWTFWSLTTRGHVTSLLVQFEKFRHFGNLRRLLVPLPYHYWRLATGVSTASRKAQFGLRFLRVLGSLVLSAFREGTWLPNAWLIRTLKVSGESETRNARGAFRIETARVAEIKALLASRAIFCARIVRGDSRLEG